MKLRQIADDDGEVVYSYYMDYESTCVWCEDNIEIVRKDHDMPFLPWVCRIGGDVSERAAEYRRRPLLFFYYLFVKQIVN